MTQLKDASSTSRMKDTAKHGICVREMSNSEAARKNKLGTHRNELVMATIANETAIFFPSSATTSYDWFDSRFTSSDLYIAILLATDLDFR